MEQKPSLKFRKYTNKSDFNLARENGEITPGTITYVEETKEIYEGTCKYTQKQINTYKGGGASNS